MKRAISEFIAASLLLIGCGGGSPDAGKSAATVDNRAPIAVVAPDQVVASGSSVTLDGSGSSDPDGNAIKYWWILTAKPAGSAATLSGPDTVKPTFVADLEGKYYFSMQVNDGRTNSVAVSVVVTASKVNIAPVARAGEAQSVVTGAIVTLNGSASSDANGDALTYSWTLTVKPPSSAAALTGATAVAPMFRVDVAGSYVVSLVVSDGEASSAATTVTVTASAPNAAPVAHAGAAQSVVAGTVVMLDGSGSSDANGDALTFAWTLAIKPPGSAATLAGAISARPTFTADVGGVYVATLVVHDGKVYSTPGTVTVTATVVNVAPVANAGAPQSVVAGAVVTLDGRGSSDANGDTLTFAWTLTSRPAFSVAALMGATSARPTFTADSAGSYVATLVVSDGRANSAPATVTVTATPAPALNFSLSGTISVVPTAAVDSDTNNPDQINQGTYRRNDTRPTAQPLTAPVMLVGTVNEANTGVAGNNFSTGDVDDWFKMDLVAGQVVELEFSAAPDQSDIDLYLESEDGRYVGRSIGVNTRYECVQATASARYYVKVSAYSKASIYTLRVGAPGTAGSCANRASAATAVPNQLLAKARRIDNARAQQLASQFQAAGLRGADLLSGAAPDGAAVPHLLQLPGDGAARALGLAMLSNRGGRLATAAAYSATTDHIELFKYAKRLEATGAFEYVQPNWLIERMALVGEFPPSDRLYPLQRWHYEQINLPAAMSRITQLAVQPVGRPLVAVIDSGVVLDHPDIVPQLFSVGRSFISNIIGDGNSASGDDPAQQADRRPFHGTHVAGTAAAATYNGLNGAGSAPMAQILPLRVFPRIGGAGQVDIINAMLYAARLINNSGSLPSRRADVINLSLGGDRECDAAYRDAISRVRAAGVIVVAAAGNDARNDIGRPAPVGTPANCEGAVAVSALDARKQITHYSNSGVQVAVAAPGGDQRQTTTGTGSPDEVYSSTATFDANGVRQPSFGPLQGTSMASPHVAGVMALMRYVNPGLTVSQVDSLLAQGALTDDLGTAGRDSKFGFGLINARKAVDAALAVAGSPSPAPAGRVLASPSNIDFGSFQTTAALELVASAATAETVVSITSDNVAVTVAATAVDPITKLGRYTVNVNRALLGAGSNYPKLTVNLAPARSFTVQLTVTKTDDGSSRSGDFGPIYVLLIHPDAWVVVKTVLATRSGGKYTWSHSGYTLPRVLVVAGADLDNDAYICQRGEPCGAFPVIAQDVDLMSITLTGDRSDIDFQVAPLSGISSQGVGDNSTKGWRRGTLPPVPVVPPPAKSILGTTRSAQ